MFCPSCHSLLDLPDSDLVLRCLTCNYQVTFGRRYPHRTRQTQTTSSSASSAPHPLCYPL